jgi:hypothetical protein
MRQYCLFGKTKYEIAKEGQERLRRNKIGSGNDPGFERNI